MREAAMSESLLNAGLLGVSVVVFLYLLYALIFPEKF
jgi:K+-transporting ATPase KdpF subunit